MLIFALAVFFLLITPGPGVLSAAGVGAAYGVKVGVRYIFGLFLGTNLVAVLVISGLATIIFSIPYLRDFLLLASSCYIIYLAIKIGLRGSEITFLKASSVPGLFEGILLQFINPKAYVVNLTLFSGFAFYPDKFIIEVLLKLLIANAIWIPIHFLWLYAGVILYELPMAKKGKNFVRGIMSLSLIIVVLLSVISMAR